jgi:hypothetical protein
VLSGDAKGGDRMALGFGESVRLEGEKERRPSAGGGDKAREVSGEASW